MSGCSFVKEVDNSRRACCRPEAAETLKQL